MIRRFRRVAVLLLALLLLHPASAAPAAPLSPKPPAWGQNVRVNESIGAADQSAPAVAFAPDGTLYAAWHDNRDGQYDVYCARSEDRGRTWGAGVRVNSNIGSTVQGFPVIAVGPSGAVYAAWVDYRNGSANADIYFASSVNRGVTWSSSIRVTDDSGGAMQLEPAIAVGSGAKVFLVWQDYRNDSGDQGNWDIYFSRSSNGGATWSANVKISDDTGRDWQGHPAIAAGPEGNLYVAWHDGRGVHSGTGFDIHLARSTNEGGVWGPSVKLNDDASTYSQYGPVVAAGRDGAVYAAWHDFRYGIFDNTPNIYTTRSLDLGVTWAPNVRANDDATPAEHAYTTLAAAGDDTVYLAWRDKRNGDQDIYFARSIDRGASWETNVRLNDDQDWADQAAPSLAVVASGAVFVAWSDLRDSKYDVYGAPGDFGRRFYLPVATR
jgi:hypothetical protein